MPTYSLRVNRRSKPSITTRDLVPDLAIAVGAVAVTAVVYVAILPLLGAKPPLVLFTATAAALTSWRGFGPGVLASSLGTSVSSSLFVHPFQGLDGRSESVPVETLVMLTGSLFVCWLVYRVKADQEKVAAVHDRRNDALAFVSHELRNPLSNVQLAAAMLERDRSEQTRERATRLIQRSATRLSKVIDDLIDVTRLDSNMLRIERKRLRLQDSILAAADAAGPAIMQRQQYFAVDVPTDPPLWVTGDDGRLQQVFANLLSNACRYSPEGAEDLAVGAAGERPRPDRRSRHRDRHPPRNARANLRSVRARSRRWRGRDRNRAHPRAQPGHPARWPGDRTQRRPRPWQHLRRRAAAARRGGPFGLRAGAVRAGVTRNSGQCLRVAAATQVSTSASDGPPRVR